MKKTSRGASRTSAIPAATGTPPRETERTTTFGCPYIGDESMRELATSLLAVLRRSPKWIQHEPFLRVRISENSIIAEPCEADMKVRSHLT
jgi:hypothetical protein